VTAVPSRLGIELSSAACRIVEIDAVPRWRRSALNTRVRSFAVLPPAGLQVEAKLASFTGRIAAAVVWGPANEHRQVVVSRGAYETMRAEALDALAVAGLQTHGVLADIVSAPGPRDRAKRQPVVVALAEAPAMSSALQPLVDAGIRLRSVATPAMALASLARLRRRLGTPGAIEAYVALEETATCIAMVRDGGLIAARDLTWGFLAARHADEPRRREDIAARLADALAAFFAAVGGSVGAVGQVCVCGALPELRSMTVPLMDRLDVEVEPLDSLFLIDPERLPDPPDAFRERGAELRVAWAVAADWPPHANLLRARRRQESKTMLARAAVVAGVAAGLGVGWRIEQSDWWRSTAPKPVERTASSTRPAPQAPAAQPRTPPPLRLPPATGAPGPAGATRGPTATPAPVTPEGAAPLGRPSTPPATPGRAAGAPLTPPSSIPSRPPAVAVPPPLAPLPAPVTTPPLAPAARPAPVRTPPPPPVSRPAPVTTPPPPPVSRPAPMVTTPPLPPQRSTAPPVVAQRAEPSPRRAASSTMPEAGVPPPTRAPSGARTAARVAEVEQPLPFEATLGTILYSPDRKLAIVDGRIVGVGDEVRGARIVDITSTAVLLRDKQGRLRRLTLGAGR
jgi:hypothetical protein